VSFYAEHTAAQAAGQILIAGFFLFQGVKNARLFAVNAGRLAAKGVPLPSAALALGLGVQFVGTGLVLTDWRRGLGAMLLIGFTVVATALFHRFWQAPPAERGLDLLLFTYNLLVIGALLMMA
jgi:putative oxidoreductase